MPGVLRPPFGSPAGPLLTDDAVLNSFIAGARTGHSESLHVEESALLVDRLIPIALRLAPSAILVRADDGAWGVPEEILTRAGLKKTHRDPPLATVVSLQVLGLPAATWSLWAKNSEWGQRQLEASAYREPPGPVA